MKVGVSNIPASQFDPIKHIDLEASTVQIDTIATNFAMFNYIPGSWAEIKECLSSAPLQHRLWHMDEAAGSQIWGSDSGPATPPVMPTPEFEMQLAPIEHWFSGSRLKPRWEKCDQEFTNIGSLIHHCRHQHPHKVNGELSKSDDKDIYAKLIADAAEYWDTKTDKNGNYQFYCHFQGCNQPYPTSQSLRRHQRCHAGACFLCTFDGCNRILPEATLIQKHLSNHYMIDVYPCKTCKWTTRWKGSLVVHEAGHLPTRRYACSHCGKPYHQMYRLIQHERRHTGENPFLCDVEGCEGAFASPDSLAYHKDTLHGSEPKKPCLFPGCNFTTAQWNNVVRHRKLRHNGWIGPWGIRFTTWLLIQWLPWGYKNTRIQDNRQ